VECYVCHASVAIPAHADQGQRWIHTHCCGNIPTVPELVAGFLGAFSSERFCLDCLGRLLGVITRRELDAAIGALGNQLRVATGRCARCPARTHVVGLHSSHGP